MQSAKARRTDLWGFATSRFLLQVKSPSTAGRVHRSCATPAPLVESMRRVCHCADGALHAASHQPHGMLSIRHRIRRSDPSYGRRLNGSTAGLSASISPHKGCSSRLRVRWREVMQGKLVPYDFWLRAKDRCLLVPRQSMWRRSGRRFEKSTQSLNEWVRWIAIAYPVRAVCRSLQGAVRRKRRDNCHCGCIRRSAEETARPYRT